MIAILRGNLSIKERIELDQTKEELEKQKMLTQYVAEMNNIYIPPEGSDTNVQLVTKNETNVQSR